jgi:hypothetical protein
LKTKAIKPSTEPGQLQGTPAAIVMKICGWRDLKTMEFYIRVAGVEEKGATDCLKILPSEAEVMGNVVSLFGLNS